LLDQAVAEYREAIRLDPANTDAHSGLGAVLLYLNDVDGAIVEWREAVRLDPTDSDAFSCLADALTRKGASV
jgi:Flp pilus assembly protein TadD